MNQTGPTRMSPHDQQEFTGAVEIEAVTRTVAVGELEFPMVDHGDGSAVLLLHGFPDSRHLWRHQVPALADAGFRVLAPDLLGFGDAPKPAEVEAYSLARILEGVVGMLDALGVKRAHVVGHDWGAAIAWLLASTRPERVISLTALTVGCPGNSGTRTIEQLEKAWYVFLFQHEGVAEEWLQRDDWSGLRALLRGGGDMERYVADLARPGALTAALNWYRANASPAAFIAPPRDLPPVRVPVLGVSADGDVALTEAHMKNSREKVVGPWKYVRMQGVTHWLMLDRPNELNRLLIDFLSNVSAPE